MEALCIALDSPAVAVDIGPAVLGGGSMVQYFEGPYTITPQAVDQHLLTRNKTMTDNLTVRMVQKFSTANEAGGRTINIGGDIYG